LQQTDSNFNYSYYIRIRLNTTHPLFGTALPQRATSQILWCDTAHLQYLPRARQFVPNDQHRREKKI